MRCLAGYRTWDSGIELVFSVFTSASELTNVKGFTSLYMQQFLHVFPLSATVLMLNIVLAYPEWIMTTFNHRFMVNIDYFFNLSLRNTFLNKGITEFSCSLYKNSLKYSNSRK